LIGETCESLGFVSGTLGCLSTCGGYDVSQCVSDDGSSPIGLENCHKEWITPVSVVSSSTRNANYLIDNNFATVGLYSWIYGRHWVILDLGESYPLDKIRIWHKQWEGGALNVEEVYVSNDLNDLGISLGELSKLSSSMYSRWNEADVENKKGRYVKLVSENPADGLAHAAYWREFDAYVSVGCD
jgi:hypothetical protein